MFTITRAVLPGSQSLTIVVLDVNMYSVLTTEVSLSTATVYIDEELIGLAITCLRTSADLTRQMQFSRHGSLHIDAYASPVRELMDFVQKVIGLQSVPAREIAFPSRAQNGLLLVRHQLSTGGNVPDSIIIAMADTLSATTEDIEDAQKARSPKSAS